MQPEAANTAAPVTSVTSTVHDILQEASEDHLLALSKELTAPIGVQVGNSEQAPTPLTSPEGATVHEQSTSIVSRAELVAAIQSLRSAKNAHEVAEREYRVALASIQIEGAIVAQRESELARRLKVIEESEQSLAARSATAESRRLELLRQEAQAEEGFPARFAQWSSMEQRKLDDLRHSLALQEEAIRTDRTTLTAETDLLKTRQRELKTAQNKLLVDQELFSEFESLTLEKKTLELNQRNSLLIESLSNKEIQVKRLEEQLKRSQEQFDDLRRQFEQAGGLSIADLTSSREHLRSEVDRLELELSRNPGHETVLEYKRQAERAHTLDAEVLRLQGQLHQKTNELDRMRIPVTELENCHVRCRNMELQYKQLKEANEALQADVENKLTAASDRLTFPEMSRMDTDERLQNSVQTTANGFNLKSLAELVRGRIANRPTPLYYDPETIRCFLGGLSMSRLHILQGISGTGKTSLPLAFAEAMSGRSDKIAVQAGWRDRQDLLGYYNAFDKRYHETEFIKALYRAQCPEWSDRVCLIILDEMNLSYIEQFGADLLAELESPHPEGAQLSLMDWLPTNPAALLRDGKAIAIPENVWFIGTANRDETTKDFADKSYDRAHAMELPRHQSRETLPNPTSSAPISRAGLSKLFDMAKRANKSDADKAVRFVESLGDHLKDGFDIGWGNRLERQIRDFVPVVVSAGGTTSEATDHLVSTKLLRKLEHRHNVRAADLKRLRTVLAEKAMSQLGPTLLSKSDAKIASLIRERAPDEGEGF